MRIVILGAPGSGKGTQAALLAEARGIPHIAAGDLLRRAVAGGTLLGQKSKAFMDAGELVPDDLVVAMMEERLGHEDCQRGYILDGFPRTVRQAQLLDKMVDLDTAVLLVVPEDVLLARFAGRLVCPRCESVYHLTGNPPAKEGVCDVCRGPLQIREDDREETVLNRLRVYEDRTAPLLERYRGVGKLMEVDASAGIEETQKRLVKALAPLDTPQEP